MFYLKASSLFQAVQLFAIWFVLGFVGAAVKRGIPCSATSPLPRINMEKQASGRGVSGHTIGNEQLAHSKVGVGVTQANRCMDAEI